jgi:hypothetical protein
MSGRRGAEVGGSCYIMGEYWRLRGWGRFVSVGRVRLNKPTTWGPCGFIKFFSLLTVAWGRTPTSTPQSDPYPAWKNIGTQISPVVHVPQTVVIAGSGGVMAENFVHLRLHNEVIEVGGGCVVIVCACASRLGAY